MAEPKYTKILAPHERILEEDAQECAPPTRTQRLLNTNIGWLLSIVFALTTLMLAVWTWSNDTYHHTGDINGLAPHFRQKIIEFMPEDRVTASIGHPEKKNETEQFWQTFAPGGLGLLSIADYTKEKYPALHPPTLQKGFKLFDTSMAHQLHCLKAIMDAYQGFLNPDHSSHGGHHDHAWHLNHCFDYIRQGIMCCGDTAIEGKAEIFPEGEEGSDGWNTKHVCKDYDQVKSWIQSKAPVIPGHKGPLVVEHD